MNLSPAFQTKGQSSDGSHTPSPPPQSLLMLGMEKEKGKILERDRVGRNKGEQ